MYAPDDGLAQRASAGHLGEAPAACTERRGATRDRDMCEKMCGRTMRSQLRREGNPTPAHAACSMNVSIQSSMRHACMHAMQQAPRALCMV